MGTPIAQGQSERKLMQWTWVYTQSGKTLKKFTFGALDLFKGLKTVGETESWWNDKL